MLSSRDCSSAVWAADEAVYSMGGVRENLGYSCGQNWGLWNDGHSHIHCWSRNHLDKHSSFRTLSSPSESIRVGVAGSM